MHINLFSMPWRHLEWSHCNHVHTHGMRTHTLWNSRPRNLEWFASTAWNAGHQAGVAGDHMSSAVLFGASADLFGAHPVKDPASLGRQKVNAPRQEC